MYVMCIYYIDISTYIDIYIRYMYCISFKTATQLYKYIFMSVRVSDRGTERNHLFKTNATLLGERKTEVGRRG